MFDVLFEKPKIKEIKTKNKDTSFNLSFFPGSNFSFFCLFLLFLPELHIQKYRYLSIYIYGCDKLHKAFPVLLSSLSTTKS